MCRLRLRRRAGHLVVVVLGRRFLHPRVVLNGCSRRRRGRDLSGTGGSRGRLLDGSVRRVWVGGLKIIICLLRLLIRLLGTVGRPLRRPVVAVVVPRIVPRGSSSSVVDKERPSSGWVDLHLEVWRQRRTVVISWVTSHRCSCMT